jgi:hypothetical protein
MRWVGADASVEMSESVAAAHRRWPKRFRGTVDEARRTAILAGDHANSVDEVAIEDQRGMT